ncbi:unnamed protein product [Rotaria socialis]|uniref:Uncharacterized protein n=2 Tax=Rotaria socialis TaxID=392032 RepID=A0A818JJI0_9BILA|nr:unnamed protein product [Rotaria socialis]
MINFFLLISENSLEYYVEIGGCTFDRPLLGEFYSYENDFATDTSLKENGVIDRRCYRQESGAGVTRNDG